jgi:hypothetical protein
MHGGLTGFGYGEYDDEEETLGGLLLGGARRKKKGSSASAMKHLHRFMKAERDAVKLERDAHHPAYAKRLMEDFQWNKHIKKSPAWMTKKYHDIYAKAPMRKGTGRSTGSHAGKIFNQSTGRWVSATGSIGKAIMAHTYGSR